MTQTNKQTNKQTNPSTTAQDKQSPRLNKLFKAFLILFLVGSGSAFGGFLYSQLFIPKEARAQCVPIPLPVSCDFDGRWGYNDQGDGNDLGVVCRSGQIIAWCNNIPRGFSSGVYTCS